MSLTAAPRKAIGANDSLMDMMVTISEGNPGALSCLVAIARKQPDPVALLQTLLFADDMNLRGSLLWLAFKDYCQIALGEIGESADAPIERLIARIALRDPNMVDFINQARGGLYGKVVVSGASYWRTTSG